MPFTTLRDYIDDLAGQGELARIKTQVDPVLEVAEVADRVMKSPAPHSSNEKDQSPAAKLGGRALLFENVSGAQMPLAINLFGSYWRINRALGTDTLESLAARVGALLKPDIPSSLIEKMKRIPDLIKMGSYPPKTVRSGICQQVVHEGASASLDMLPIIQCWPLDGDLDSGQMLHPEHLLSVKQRGTGRYITLAGIYTKNPTSGERNVGMYRVQKFSSHLAAMHWHMHHDGARHFRMYQQRGEKCRWRLCWGANRFYRTLPPRPCPRAWRNSYWRDF